MNAWGLALALGCWPAPEPPGHRLADEASPYLRRHAQDPVDWYPWGDPAFARARRLDRPVLLSIGYASCHWCHVMADESFRDPEIAAWLNDHYVAIKVDREERPDVDAIYMAALLATGAPGGWPLTVWVTPDGEPFHATSYLPARDGDRGRDTGFLTVLKRLSDAWETDRDGVTEAAGELAAHLRSVMAPSPIGALPGEDLLAAHADLARRRYDPVHGGRRGAPKFPSGLPLRFLLNEHRRTGADDLRDLAVHTLRAMAGGGLRDPLGGGFHRYATDEAWRVPHFEKMLPDNALLASAYTDAFLVTGDPDLERIARETLAWAERELPGSHGPFGSALDADTEGEEGRYYTWTAAEVEAALGPEAAPAALAFYGVSAERSVLAALDAPTGALEDARATLLAARARRPRPLRDDKAVLGWNALLAEALLRAGLAFDDPALVAKGASTVDALIRDAYTRVVGRAEPPPMVEDLAHLVSALITAFEATAEPRYLREAIDIDRDLLPAYADPHGGWYRTPTHAERLLARERPDRDGAEPAGASVHVASLLRLAALTGDDAYRVRADRALGAYAAPLSAGRLPEMLRALDRRLDPSAREVVIVVPDDRAAAAPFVRGLLARGPRNHVLVVVREADVEAVGRVAPIVAGKVAVDGSATAYVCSAGVCESPTTAPEALYVR